MLHQKLGLEPLFVKLCAVLAKLQAETQWSVVCDHLGTPVELHDRHGGQAWAAELDSYGRVRREEGERNACPFRYQGQYEDVETGLYYNRFHYYDPHAGNYISQDPIRLIGGDALYAYVHDPVTWIDEFGLRSTCPNAVQTLPQLRGKSVPKIQKTLKKNGFVHRNPANPKNERWVHPDGSEVQIHKYGNNNTTPYKSGNNAHIHKSIGKHGDTGTIELNDRGIPSTVASETHIGIKNPADYPVVSGRPHGT